MPIIVIPDLLWITSHLFYAFMLVVIAVELWMFRQRRRRR